VVLDWLTHLAVSFEDDPIMLVVEDHVELLQNCGADVALCVRRGERAGFGLREHDDRMRDREAAQLQRIQTADHAADAASESATLDPRNRVQPGREEMLLLDERTIEDDGGPRSRVDHERALERRSALIDDSRADLWVRRSIECDRKALAITVIH